MCVFIRNKQKKITLKKGHITERKLRISCYNTQLHTCIRVLKIFSEKKRRIVLSSMPSCGAKLEGHDEVKGRNTMRKRNNNSTQNIDILQEKL